MTGEVGRRGPRPAGEDTRSAILAAAREEFATSGYAGASLRGIARRAGVDPRLVHHYFDGKAALFAEIIDLPLNPAAVVAGIVDGDPDELGARIVRTFLTVWDHDDNRPALLALIRTGVTGESNGVAQLREYLSSGVVGRIVRAHPHAATLSPKERTLRAGLIASQMMGLALARYVIEFPGVAGVPLESLVERIGPIIQGHLEN